VKLEARPSAPATATSAGMLVSGRERLSASLIGATVRRPSRIGTSTLLEPSGQTAAPREGFSSSRTVPGHFGAEQDFLRQQKLSCACSRIRSGSSDSPARAVARPAARGLRSGRAGMVRAGWRRPADGPGPRGDTFDGCGVPAGIGPAATTTERLSSKGQLVIPASVRKRLGGKQHDELEIRVLEGERRVSWQLEPIAVAAGGASGRPWTRDIDRVSGEGRSQGRFR
jgi:AbrB family looped-hinge helix DNA binding protein